MKKRFLPLLAFGIFALGSCSRPLTIYEVTVNGVFDTYIDCKYDVGESFSSLDKELNSYISSFGEEVEKATAQINSTNEKVKVSEEVFCLIQEALSYEAKTDGYFNPLLGKVNYIWKDYLDSNDDSLSFYEETKEKSDAAFKEIKDSSLELDKNDHFVKRKGRAELDLGGIAKGYCIKRVKEKILAVQSKHYLINGGSSSLSMGLMEDNSSFRVRLENTGTEVYRYLLGNIDSSTSSALSQCKQVPLEGSIYLSHIVNPKTGSPLVTTHAMTFFVGEDSAMLDAFSTAAIFAPLDLIKEWETQYNLKCSIFEFGNDRSAALLYENANLEKA